MRNMRQVIKTNHNFMTGEHYEQRVLKPVQASHNRVTIQLCDAASGQVVEEAVTENAITPLFECSAYGSIAQQLNNNALNGGLYSYPTFASIVLSDSDISELEDPYFIHGNVVGMCNRADTSGAGNSKYRGTYNSAESYEKFEDNGYKHIHLVYDWSTSSGNGKIQNIYWLPAGFNYDYPGYTRAIATLQSFNNSYNSTDVTFDKRGNMYKKVSNKWYKILNMLKFVNGIESAKLATEESFHNDFEVNGYYYTFSYSSANVGTTSCTFTLTINKHDTSGTIVDTWTEDLITAVPQLVELRNNSMLGGYDTLQCNAVGYCDDDGWVGFSTYYHSRGSSSSYYVFPVRNSAGELEQNKSYSVAVYTMYNVLTKQWLRVPNPWDVWCTYAHWTDQKVIKKVDNRNITVDGLLIEIDAGSSDVYGEQYALNWESPGYNRYLIYPYSIHSNLPICACYSSNTSGLYAIRPISAQTRLAAPITKTTLNTLKIQYDFFFKVPLPYMPPEHVWDLYK
jgi:hypothetical protein